jgi:hypothetical protein
VSTGSLRRPTRKIPAVSALRPDGSIRNDWRRQRPVATSSTSKIVPHPKSRGPYTDVRVVGTSPESDKAVAALRKAIGVDEVTYRWPKVEG